MSGYWEIAAVLLLIVLNGVFALSELALVSSRPARLQTLRDNGVRGAAAAIELASDSSRFLSTVQIGITLIGIVAGAFSGATLGTRLSAFLAAIGVSPAVAEPLGVAVVVAVITYLSLVIGELVPKQLALRRAETIACAVAPTMKALSRIAAPLVWLLDASTRSALKLIGQTEQLQSQVTEEEIKTLISEAETAGVLETGERRMITAVLRFGDRSARALMTPRTEADWIDLSRPESEILSLLLDTRHPRLPVSERGSDEMIGIVEAREVLAACVRGQPIDVRAHVRATPIVSDRADALHVLQILKGAEVPMALVHDEYGHFEGVITPADILEAIAGAFRSDVQEDEHPAVQREDGSWLLAGYLPADEMADLLRIRLPGHRDYNTAAGFMLAQLGHIPKVGECMQAGGWRLEVVDLDGRRIDKILASRTTDTHRQI